MSRKKRRQPQETLRPHHQDRPHSKSITIAAAEDVAQGAASTAPGSLHNHSFLRTGRHTVGGQLHSAWETLRPEWKYVAVEALACAPIAQLAPNFFAKRLLSTTQATYGFNVIFWCAMSLKPQRHADSSSGRQGSSDFGIRLARTNSEEIPGSAQRSHRPPVCSRLLPGLPGCHDLLGPVDRSNQAGRSAAFASEVDDRGCNPPTRALNADAVRARSPVSNTRDLGHIRPRPASIVYRQAR